MPRTALAIPALLLALAPGLRAEDVPQDQGMEVLPAIRKAVNWATSTPDPDKPWANDLAALTDLQPQTYALAIRNLIVAGPKVLPDLEVMAGDSDWRIRTRVLQVAAGIGGSAGAPLVLRLSRDPDLQVRETATLALGNCAGAGVRTRLEELAAVPESTVREKAAQSLGALGEPAAIAALATAATDADDLVRREAERALARLCDSPAGAAELAVQLAACDGLRRDALLATAAGTLDPRLCPVLVAIARNPLAGPRGRAAEATAWTVWSAVKALEGCGDSRAWELLARFAAEHPQDEVRSAAATALATLTGYRAAPGRAWTVWWNDRRAEAARRMPIDADLAAWRDPAATPDAARLAAYGLADLEPLLEACLGRPAGRIPAWWPAAALRILARDDGARWADALAGRIIAQPLSAPGERMALALLLERLGGAAALPHLRRVLADLDQRAAAEAKEAEKANAKPLDHGAERLLLSLAIARLDPPKPSSSHVGGRR